MLFTATLMICLIDKPQNYNNCEILKSDYKYASERSCWNAINSQMLSDYQSLKNEGYEYVSGKCTSWINNDELNT